MDKKVKRKIEYAFYNYRRLVESAVQSTVDIADAGLAAQYGSPRVQSTTDNKRESRLCKAIDNSLEAWRWCNVVEHTLDHYACDGRDKIIRLRYFKGYSVNHTCSEYGIAQRTFFNFRDEFLGVSEYWAKKFNLL
ncbi:MAG: hypothetical protein J6V66_00660 [Clostridia bacterium]|nr:hypothetical protein [Clostridia bacterium]